MVVPNRYTAVGVDRVVCYFLLVGCDCTDNLLIVGLLGGVAVVKLNRCIFGSCILCSHIIPPLTPFVAAHSSPLAVYVLIVVILLH